MNVDAHISQAAYTATPQRPLHTSAEQQSARPVDRPHHDEAPDNRSRQDRLPGEAEKEAQRPAGEQRTVRQESELDAQAKRELEQLKARDREVRAHEAAHKAAAGALARGGAQFEYQTGPNGRRYAVGGEVSIDTAKVAGDPQATIDKAQTIRRAANAPAQPSGQDRAVAAKASQMEAEARQELTEQQVRESGSTDAQAPGRTPEYSANEARPAAVGELLDVIV